MQAVIVMDTPNSKEKIIMLVTMVEARERWCCQARADAVRQVEQNLVIPCIPGACMAWRWVGGRVSGPKKKVLQGYCGLAGKPEGVA